MNTLAVIFIALYIAGAILNPIMYALIPVETRQNMTIWLWMVSWLLSPIAVPCAIVAALIDVIRTLIVGILKVLGELRDEN